MNAATGRKQYERGKVSMNVLSNRNIDQFGYVIKCITQKPFSKGCAKVTKPDIMRAFGMVYKAL
jgi:hypothetical protein